MTIELNERITKQDGPFRLDLERRSMLASPATTCARNREVKARGPRSVIAGAEDGRDSPTRTEASATTFRRRLQGSPLVTGSPDGQTLPSKPPVPPTAPLAQADRSRCHRARSAPTARRSSTRRSSSRGARSCCTVAARASSCWRIVTQFGATDARGYSISSRFSGQGRGPLPDESRVAQGAARSRARTGTAGPTGSARTARLSSAFTERARRLLHWIVPRPVISALYVRTEIRCGSECRELRATRAGAASSRTRYGSQARAACRARQRARRHGRIGLLDRPGAERVFNRISETRAQALRRDRGRADRRRQPRADGRSCPSRARRAATRPATTRARSRGSSTPGSRASAGSRPRARSASPSGSR